MLKLISQRRAIKILNRYDAWIKEVSGKYSVPSTVIKAVLYKEMTGIDILDPLADLAVLSGLFHKKDSSVGYAQIFGRTAIRAINFAAARGIIDYASLGLPSGRIPDPDNEKDIRSMWKYLRKNRYANIEAAALNLLSCAQEMTGRIDFTGFSDDELKLVLTRYNADTDHITAYGEEVFRLMQKML
ncbi:MAG: hypothetical protein J6P87_04100 [Lachnospiraceae bacterium]|nr:hypothetical protein [Lachnospiraceae bacterium]